MVANAGDTRPAQLLRGDVGNGEPLRWRDLRRARRWRSPLAAALAIGSASDPMFAAIGIGAHRRACAACSPCSASLIRRIARGAQHRGGPITRLGIAALDRPGAATGAAGGLARARPDAAGDARRDRRRASSPRSTPTSRSAPRPCSWSTSRAPRSRSSARWPARELPGAELRLVPSLRGPVTAVNGTRGDRHEGDSRRRLDPARRPRPDLRRATCRRPTGSSPANGGRRIIAARRWSASTSMRRPRSASRSATR